MAPSQVKSLLLTADEVTAVMGATAMTGGDVYTTMGSGSITVPTKPGTGAAYNAQASVYNGSGWSAVSDQTLKQPRAERPTDNSAWVNQTVVTFPSDAQARAFLDASADDWKDKDKTITATVTDSGSTWTFGDLSRDGDTNCSTQHSGGRIGMGVSARPDRVLQRRVRGHRPQRPDRRQTRISADG